MENKNLYDKLNWMKSELTALKTAHSRGLGTTKFYSRRIQHDAVGRTDSTNYLIMTITVANGEPIPPFMQVAGEDRVSEVHDRYFTNGNKSLVCRFLYYEKKRLTFTITSFSAISNVSIVDRGTGGWG